MRRCGRAGRRLVRSRCPTGETRIGELRRPVVVVDKVLFSRRRQPQFPSGRERTQIDVARGFPRHPRIVPRDLTCRCVEEVHLSLFGSSNFEAFRQVCCRRDISMKLVSTQVISMSCGSSPTAALSLSISSRLNLLVSRNHGSRPLGGPRCVVNKVFPAGRRHPTLPTVGEVAPTVGLASRSPATSDLRSATIVGPWSAGWQCIWMTIFLTFGQIR